MDAQVALDTSTHVDCASSLQCLGSAKCAMHFATGDESMALYNADDVALLTDGSMHKNGCAIAVALCEEHSSHCYANWHYKFGTRAVAN